MPIELLDRLRALTHNMGWLDEGGEEQDAFVAIEVDMLARDMREYVNKRYGCTPHTLRDRWAHTLDNF